jgi:hypothetical protein
MGLQGLLEPVHFSEYSDPDMSWGLEDNYFLWELVILRIKVY